jgi:hypothetical protein
MSDRIKVGVAIAAAAVAYVFRHRISQTITYAQSYRAYRAEGETELDARYLAMNVAYPGRAACSDASLGAYSQSQCMGTDPNAYGVGNTYYGYTEGSWFTDSWAGPA